MLRKCSRFRSSRKPRLLSKFRKEPNDDRVAKYYIETIARSFPNPLAGGLTAGGEGYEVVNHNSWTRLAVSVTNIRRRTCSSRSRDSLLAQRRFRRERGVERCTVTRRALRSRSKENSLWQPSCISRRGVSGRRQWTRRSESQSCAVVRANRGRA
jgi:hypothetical protein